MASVLRAKAALVQAASDLEWLKVGGKAEQVADIVQNAVFWDHLNTTTSFLQPFSDMIHQIEADRPALRRCYVGLMQLDKHVCTSVKEFEEEFDFMDDCQTMLKSWERRLDDKAVDRKVQPLLNASHIAAYLLDPLHAVCNEADLSRATAQMPSCTLSRQSMRTS
jgi:hypothetical protein